MEQRNHRIQKIYINLLKNHLNIEITKDCPDVFLKHCQFSVQDGILSGGVTGLCAVILVLYLILYPHHKKVSLSDDDQCLISVLTASLIAKADKDNGYVSYFDATQQPSEFDARPFVTKEGQQTPPNNSSYVPSTIPWENHNFDTPAAVWFRDSAATGKSTLYQTLATALTGTTDESLSLAAQLKLDRSQKWVVIGLSAQQYLYNWNQEENRIKDLQNIFFQGVMSKNNLDANNIQQVLSTIVPQKVKDACEHHRLILLVDGIDELSPKLQETFCSDLEAFTEAYPNAHRVLFSRPLGSVVTNRLKKLFSTIAPLPQDADRSLGEGVPNTALMEKLMRDHPEASLSQNLYDYAKQIIHKDYDYDGHVIMLPKELQTQNPQVLAEQLAWNLSINPNLTVTNALTAYAYPDKKTGILSATESAELQEIALKIGVLIPDENHYRFISPQVQGVLAAAHILRQLHNHESFTTYRTNLRTLKDPECRNICLGLLAFLSEEDPLLTEILLSDFILRKWSDDYKAKIRQDLTAMREKKSGNSPFQRSSDTFGAMFELAFPE